MMPELGMDMFETDMATVPWMPNNGSEEEVLPLPEETMMEPMQATEAEPLHDEHTVAAPAMPSDQGIPMYYQQLASTSDMANHHQASHTS